jgi:hypothetical protein
VLKAFPHRHFVLSIPKILRRFFLHDRKLLEELGRCGWDALRSFLRAAVPESAGLPGAVIAVQTFGDFPERFHPHCHVLCPDGCFYGRGGFRVAPKLHLRDLESLFRHKVLRMLLARGMINEDLIRIMGAGGTRGSTSTRARGSIRRKRRGFLVEGWWLEEKTDAESS